MDLLGTVWMFMSFEVMGSFYFVLIFCLLLPFHLIFYRAIKIYNFALFGWMIVWVSERWWIYVEKLQILGFGNRVQKFWSFQILIQWEDFYVLIQILLAFNFLLHMFMLKVIFLISILYWGSRKFQLLFVGGGCFSSSEKENQVKDKEQFGDILIIQLEF